RNVLNAEDFQYHHRCDQQRILNLCFVDDLFLFARGHPNLVNVIMHVLEEFKNVSGLVPSIPKSMAFFCIVPNALKAFILSLMPFAEGSLPFRYLGVPLISYRLLFHDCKVLVEKLESRVNDWRNKFLSLAGRLQLVRYVLSSWDLKSGKAKVAWEAICKPKREGGLGIRRLEDFNVALMATHIWFLNLVLTLVPNLHDDIEDVIIRRDISGCYKPFPVACAWDSLRLRAVVVDWYHVVWFPHCIPQHAIYLWLIVKEKLKTRDRLWQWDVKGLSPRLVDVLAFLIPISKSRSMGSGGIVGWASSFDRWRRGGGVGSISEIVREHFLLVRERASSDRGEREEGEARMKERVLLTTTYVYDADEKYDYIVSLSTTIDAEDDTVDEELRTRVKNTTKVKEENDDVEESEDG
ncbi:reverse transcriptase domain, reverse transcriptase zinc-binding domain protein, partial [Tanacetum coccineum]